MIAVPLIRQGSAPCQLNLTALLDVVLQLIVFFILVSQFGLEDRPDLALPDLQDPQVQRTGQHARLFVNLLATTSATAELAVIKVGDQSFTPAQLPAATEFLATALEKQPDLQVLLRSDAALPYTAVQPVLEAIRTAGVQDVGLVALARPLDEPR